MIRSLHVECLHAVARCATVAIFATAVARLLYLSLGGRARQNPVVWALLLAPCLVPPLLAGYAYAGFSHSVLLHPALKELTYALLLAVRLVPIATVAWWCMPRRVSREAIHCHRLLRPLRPRLQHAVAHLRLLMRAEPGAGLVVGVLVFLLAFAEFEQASLLGIGQWTVALFDAQAGGTTLTASLRLATEPVVWSLCALLPALLVLQGLRSRGLPAIEKVPAPWHRVFLWAYVGMAFAGAVALPASVVLRGTVAGFATMVRSFSLQRELAASLGMGIAAAAVAYLIVDTTLRRTRRHWTGPVLACTPGLTGGLVLALIVQWVFTLPVMRVAYDTPLPLLTGLVLRLLPFALLLSRLLRTRRPAEATHAAGLLRQSPDVRVRRVGSRLLWLLRYRRRFWIFGFLFCLAFFDVTLSAILAPTSLPLATARLYNFMHYGRSAVLSSMLCCTVALAAATLAALYAVGREGVRRAG